MRTCPGCGSPLPIRSNAQRVTCSPRCRQRVARAHHAGIPSEMREADRWVRHDERKRPLTIGGRLASSTDPTTWTTFERARRSTVGAGLGFVLGGGCACIDLDHCLDGDVVTSRAAIAVLAMNPRSWVERSPSGDGLHVWGRSTEAPGRVDRARGVEAYSVGRYITVTGKTFRRGALAPLVFP